MNLPLQRIRNGAIILVIILVFAVIGYRVLGKRDWLDAVYMVVITISSVGFSEESNLESSEKIFTIAVIVFGMLAAGYTLGGFFQLMTEGEIARALGLRHVTREIEQLKNHVIICGFGRIGQILAEELQRHDVSFVVVDHDGERIAEAQAQGHLALNGDATEEDVLLSVGIGRAKTLVTALAGDADNVFITLTSRDLNPGLQIIARGEFRSTRKKLMQAGADRVVLPATIGAQRMAAMITRPTTVELLELVAGRGVVDVAMDELLIPGESLIVDKTVQGIEARRRFGLLVVAVKLASGDMIFSPDDALVFRAGDTIIVMGKVEDIEKFRLEYRM